MDTELRLAVLEMLVVTLLADTMRRTFPLRLLRGTPPEAKRQLLEPIVQQLFASQLAALPKAAEKQLSSLLDRALDVILDDA